MSMYKNLNPVDSGNSNTSESIEYTTEEEVEDDSDVTNTDDDVINDHHQQQDNTETDPFHDSTTFDKNIK